MVAIASGSALPGERQAHISVPELLAEYPLFQAVAGIEQHPHCDGLVGKHLDAADVARLVVVGHGRDRPLVPLQHFDHDKGGVGEQGAAPAARAERAESASAPAAPR